SFVSQIDGIQQFKFKPNSKLIITVKTSSVYYKTRLRYILETWFNLAPNYIYFVSDKLDPRLPIDLGNHFIYTKCGVTHQRSTLVCKLSVELEMFFQAKADWSCHFDDDNYVNIPNLINFLSDFNPDIPHYIGRISVGRRIKVIYRNQTIGFTFGTGGAGFCLSRWVVSKLFELAKNNITLLNVSNEIGTPDDVTLGFMI
ncbi:hypothetical protein PFISCL1PPCAC_5543, partial [Pristionchus fissidentatus]